MQKVLGSNFGGVTDATETQTDAHLRIVRVSVKGKDSDVPCRAGSTTISPIRRAASRRSRFALSNEIYAFGHADDVLVQSLRFVEKTEKAEKK